MRVLHVAPSLDPTAGGTVQAVQGMVAAQHAAGVEPSVVATTRVGSPPQVAESLRKLGIQVHTIGPARGPLQSHPDIDRTLDALVAQADVVHVHAVWEQIQHRAAVLAARWSRPYVVSPHGMLAPWSLAQKPLKKRIYLMWRLLSTLQRAAAIHCTSQASAEAMRALVPASRPFVEPLGIDLSEFSELPDRGEFRAAYPEVGDRPIVLFMSRLDPVKGLDLLLPAFADAAPDDAMLVVAGPGPKPYRVALEAMVNSNGLDARVVLTGMLRGRNRISALVDADVFVLSSYHESFGIVVAEALASGTPVIVSDQVGLHDQVTRAEIGAVVPTRVRPLAEELRQWMGDPARRAQVGKRAREYALEHFDWTPIAKRWSEHYARLARRRPVD